LQILVMSAHAKEHQFVVKAFQEGADDFLQKPLGENRPRIDERIRDALRKSGRENHERCKTALADAKTGVAPVRLVLDGRPVGRRVEIKIEDKAVELRVAEFLTL